MHGRLGRLLRGAAGDLSRDLAHRPRTAHGGGHRRLACPADHGRSASRSRGERLGGRPPHQGRVLDGAGRTGDGRAVRLVAGGGDPPRRGRPSGCRDDGGHAVRRGRGRREAPARCRALRRSHGGGGHRGARRARQPALRVRHVRLRDGQCRSGGLRRAALRFPGRQQPRRRLARPGVSLVDLTPWICPDDLCVGVIGNVAVYRDDNHLTRLYARTLGPSMAEQLPAALG